jgi:hypothetical protein
VEDRIDAAHTEKAVVFKKDINPFVLARDKFDVRYVLALLNSRFISWLYVNTSSIATKDDFRQTTLAELRELPIPAASPEKQKALERLVDRILAAKQRDAETDVSELEREIDQLVYGLYGLTKEEIQIVEGAAK